MSPSIVVFFSVLSPLTVKFPPTVKSCNISTLVFLTLTMFVPTAPNFKSLSVTVVDITLSVILKSMNCADSVTVNLFDTVVDPV